MGLKRIIMEQYDDDSQPHESKQMQDQRPMEYELPTRGQSFTDGMVSSFWGALKYGACVTVVLIIIFLILSKLGC